MFKALRALIMTAVMTASLAVSAEALEVTGINDLIENANVFGETQVAVEGEAIGEALERGGYAWVNINDGTNAIGIWMKSSDADKISFFGDYRHTGDTVRVTGIFSRDCEEHGGDVDIHCSTIEIVSRGNVIKETVNPIKTRAAIMLCCLSLMLTAFYILIGRKPIKTENA